MLVLMMGTNTFSQQLLTPSFTFSHSKTAYITLANGQEIIGVVNNINRKKGLIKFIKIEDGNGQSHKLDPADVAYMYLPPSGLDKLGKASDFLYDATKWNDEKLDQDLLNQGLVYFEQSNVMIKKKTRTLLMQLLNPSFSAAIKIYHDPFADETMSLGVAGIKVAGGIDKSYFIKKGEHAAYKFEKRKYNKEFNMLYSECNAIKEKYGNDHEWSDLAKHVLEYTKECNAMTSQNQ